VCHNPLRLGHVAARKRLQGQAPCFPGAYDRRPSRVELDPGHAGQLPADLAVVDCLSHERTSASTSEAPYARRGMRG